MYQSKVQQQSVLNGALGLQKSLIKCPGVKTECSVMGIYNTAKVGCVEFQYNEIVKMQWWRCCLIALQTRVRS